MNKEAIERTKARCKKEIKHKDKIMVAPGWYIKKSDCVVVNVGEMVPASYIPYPNIFKPLSKKELIAIPIMVCLITVAMFWWLS